MFVATLPELPWAISEEEERRFKKILRRVSIFFLVFALVMPFLPVPEPDRDKVEAIPPRLAKLILERKKKPSAVPNVAKKKAHRKKPKARKKPKKDIAAARRKAASSGLLALSSDLAALRDDSLLSSVSSNRTLTRSGKKAKQSQRSVITRNIGRGSGGINTAKLGRGTGGGALSGRSTTQVSSSLQGGGGGRLSRGGGHRASRPIEEIRQVFDRNKNSIYILYNRALRKDPSLEGKLLLELTIAPSGKVLVCRVLSSEIKAPVLIRKLVARIKLFNFGAKDVATVKVTYPIEFFPS